MRTAIPAICEGYDRGGFDSEFLPTEGYVATLTSFERRVADVPLTTRRARMVLSVFDLGDDLGRLQLYQQEVLGDTTPLRFFVTTVQKVVEDFFTDCTTFPGKHRKFEDIPVERPLPLIARVRDRYDTVRAIKGIDTLSCEEKALAVATLRFASQGRRYAIMQEGLTLGDEHVIPNVSRTMRIIRQHIARLAGDSSARKPTQRDVDKAETKEGIERYTSSYW